VGSERGSVGVWRWKFAEVGIRNVISKLEFEDGGGSRKWTRKRRQEVETGCGSRK
jgi:hypothetical protein